MRVVAEAIIYCEHCDQPMQRVEYCAHCDDYAHRKCWERCPLAEDDE